MTTLHVRTRKVDGRIKGRLCREDREYWEGDTVFRVMQLPAGVADQLLSSDERMHAFLLMLVDAVKGTDVTAPDYSSGDEIVDALREEIAQLARTPVSV